jgi:hypothetical protein
MAFVLDVDTDPRAIVRHGETVYIQVTVGHDDIELKAYSVVVLLGPLAGGDSELVFYLVEADGETDTEHEFWSGKDVARFIPREDRKVIVTAFRSAAAHLLQKCQPRRVFCCTFDEKPPEKALVKYTSIFSAFEECGYSVVRNPPSQGKVSWWLERTDDEPVAQNGKAA